MKTKLIGHYKLRFNAPVIVAFISVYIIWKYISFSLLDIIALILVISGTCIWFAGLLALRESFSLKAKAHKLVTKGIYSKISHPIYLGGIFVFIGWCIFLQTVWIYIFTFLLLVIEIIRTKKENKILLETFGDEYKKYKSGTWI